MPRQQRDIGRRAVGCIGPNTARCVVRIEHRAKLPAIVGRGIGDRETADEAMPAIDLEMVLVANTGTTISLAGMAMM